LGAFISFEPLKGLQNRRIDIREFRCSGDGTSNSFENDLKTIKVRGRKIKKKIDSHLLSV
jgi:hypothetical protein